MDHMDQKGYSPMDHEPNAKGVLPVGTENTPSLVQALLANARYRLRSPPKISVVGSLQYTW
jgi:hypothetical protein